MSENISKDTKDKMGHMIGLGSSRKPYRNYYCAGSQLDEDLESLIPLNYIIKQDGGETMGGWYYYLTDEGLTYMLNNPDDFDMDRRIKKLKTLKDKIYC